MWLFELFNNKPKTVYDIGYELFLKSNGMNKSTITKSVFDILYYNVNIPYIKEAELILRKEKIKKLKRKIKGRKCLKLGKN